MTPYGAATPLCPSGYDGTGPSASLELLDVTHGYALTSLRSFVSQARLGAPPSTWPRGARNAARPTCAEAPLLLQNAIGPAKPVPQLREPID